MTIAYVNSVAAAQSGSTIVLTRTTASGALLVVGIQRPNSQVSTVTDSAGNTWLYAYASTAFTSTINNTDAAVEVWYCPNAASVTSVTVTMNATDNGNAVLVEASGAETVAPLNYVGASGATSTSVNMPSANENAYSYAGGGAGSTAPGPTNHSQLVLSFGGYTETSAGTSLDTPVGGTIFAARSNNGTHTLTSQYKALAAGNGYSVNGVGANFGWTLGTAKASGIVTTIFRSTPIVAISGTPTGGYEDDLGSNGYTDTPLSWTPVALRQAWPMITGATTSVQPDNVIRAVKIPVLGQLWPRGTTGNGTYS